MTSCSTIMLSASPRPLDKHFSRSHYAALQRLVLTGCRAQMKSSHSVCGLKRLMCNRFTAAMSAYGLTVPTCCAELMCSA